MNNKKRYKFLPQAETGRLSENDTKKYFSTLGFAVSAFILATSGAALAISIICSMWFPWVLENDILSKLISMVCQYGLGLPALMLVLSRLPKDTNPKEKLGFKQLFGYFCLCLTFMSVGSNISTSITSFFEGMLGKTILNPVETSTSGTHWAINLVFYAILAPILEELVFRKLICDRLLPLGELYAVFLSAAVFALSHGNFHQFFYAFFVGSIFSYIYVKSGNLVYTTVIHMIINLLGGVISPWAMDKLEPIMTEESINTMLEMWTEQGASEELVAMLSPYILPVYVLFAYILIINVFSIIGFVVLMKNLRRVRFADGLLRPAEENRVSNLFLNGGVCAAISLFTGFFLISLFKK